MTGKDLLTSATNRIRGLTLDVCTGTYLSAEMARKYGAPDCSQWLPILIVCAVYVIYVMDHLVDYRRSVQFKRTYKFYWIGHMQGGILVSVVLVGGVAGFVCSQMDMPLLLIFGIVMGLLVAGYYLLALLYKQNRIKWYPKEAIIAAVFTTAIWGYYPLQQSFLTLSTVILILGFSFSMLLNACLFSYFDKEEDARVSYFNMMNYLGKHTSRRCLNGIIVAGFLVNTLALWYDAAAGTILLAMFLYLAGVYWMRGRLQTGSQNGLLIDAVLFLSGFYGLLI